MAKKLTTNYFFIKYHLCSYVSIFFHLLWPQVLATLVLIPNLNFPFFIIKAGYFN